MQQPGNKTVVAVLSDLLFTVKIQDAAKRAGLDVVFVKSREAALQRARQHPAVMVFDLNDAAIDPLRLIADLKAADDTRDVRLLGYVSHVQTEVRRAALESGCEAVLPRSAFSQNLPDILKRYAGE